MNTPETSFRKTPAMSYHDKREGKQTRALTDWDDNSNSYHMVRNPFSNKEAALDPKLSHKITSIILKLFSINNLNVKL